MARAKTQSQQKQPKQRRAKSTPKQIPRTFMQHIVELRKRLFWTALVGLGLGAAAYSYYDPIMKVIMAPLNGEKLIYLTPGGGFAFIFSAMLYVTAIGVLPFFLYQVYAFLKPAIPNQASKISVKVALASASLMVAGVSFGYFVAIPQGIVFFTSFASEYVAPSLTAESYLNFVFSYALGIGALFQLPLLLMLWQCFPYSIPHTDLLD